MEWGGFGWLAGVMISCELVKKCYKLPRLIKNILKNITKNFVYVINYHYLWGVNGAIIIGDHTPLLKYTLLD